MPLPRLRIAHQLSLLMAAAVVLAVVVVAGLSALNLRSGFRDYLQARDDEQLVRLVALVEQRSAQDPQLNWLRAEPEPMRALMDAFNGRAPRPPAAPGRPRPGDEQRPPRPEGRPPPNPPRDSMGDRLMIRDALHRERATDLSPTAIVNLRALVNQFASPVREEGNRHLFSLR